MPKVKRGEIWLVDLSPQSFKAEPGKTGRPCCVIQSDVLNGVSHSTAIVIPGTTQIYRDQAGDGFPLKVPVGKIQKPGESPEETDLMIDQIRAISNARFMGNAPIGTLSRQQIKRVEDALRYVLGMQ